MRYIVDHDLHIHTRLSICSEDAEQNPDAILAYGEKNNLKTLCLTDHMWDSAVPGASEWYARQPYEHICASLPLPKSDTVKFLFGCETELDRHMTLGISPAVMEKLDFIIIPTTHMDMIGFTVEGNEDVEERVKLWCKRLDAVLDMDLPFYKMGIAHPTCHLIYKEHHLEVLNAIPKEEYHRLFAKAAKVGVGIELNSRALQKDEDNLDIALLPYQIAKEEGCKFYFGSDAHHPVTFTESVQIFEKAVDLLELTEEDKIDFLRKN